MKKILIISSFVLLGLASVAQIDSTRAKYKCYKPCPDCTEKWEYGKGSSPKLDYNSRVNQTALQTRNRTNNFARTLVGVVATVFIGAITTAVITKSTNFANNAIH